MPQSENITPDEFRDLVISRTDEVLAILYEDATRQWAEAHLATSRAAANVATLNARIMWLKTLISKYHSDTKEEPDAGI